MLPLNETIKDVITWRNYITEDQGAIPGGLEAAITYLNTLRAMIDNVDKKNYRKDVKILRDWLESKGYYTREKENLMEESKNEVPKKRNSTKTKRRSKGSGMGNGNDHE